MNLVTLLYSYDSRDDNKYDCRHYIDDMMIMMNTINEFSLFIYINIYDGGHGCAY